MHSAVYRLVLAGTIAVAAAAALPAQTTGPAADVIEQYITALGGRAALNRARTSELVRERSQFGTLSRVYRIDDPATKRFYQRVDAPDGVLEQGYDGQRAWQKRAAFHGYLSDDELLVRQLKNPEPDIREYRESGRTYKALPNERVNDIDYVVLEGIQRQPIGGDVPVKFYFDPSTHLLRRKAYGNIIQVVQTFDDYRRVGDILVPFETTTEQPQGKVVLKTKLYRFDVPIADSLFIYRENAKPIEPPSAGASGSSQTLSPQVRAATFNYVWEKTRDTYWDSTFGGVDWKAVRDRYWTLANDVTESVPFHSLLSRMVGELHVSHFHVRPPEAILTEGTTAADFASRPNATPGLDVRSVDGRLVVLSVESGSPADSAGVRPGFVIDSIDGRSIESVVADWRKKNPDFELKRLTTAYAGAAALRGPAATRVRLSLIDGNDLRTSRAIGRRQLRPGTAMRLDFASKRLSSNYGYIRWNIFLDDAVERFARALDELRDAQALIIDLRGNPGGVGVMARAIASMLMRDSAALGTAIFRHERQRYRFAGSGDKAYAGDVVILVDEGSGSTSEVLAAGLQDLRRAVVIGDTTAGAVLPSNADLLPSGGTFQHPISDYISAGGARLEGRGVIPDIVSRPTRRSLLKGEDVVLDRAVQFLRNGRQ